MIRFASAALVCALSLAAAPSLSQPAQAPRNPMSALSPQRDAIDESIFFRRRLREWVALEGATEEAFAASVSANIDSGREEYERAMPFWQSYAGLKRYWEKRSLKAALIESHF